MHPFERQRQAPVPGIKPSLQFFLKEGWRGDAAKKSFVSSDGEVISLKGVLPSRTKIVPLIPSLATADLETLSGEERYLARQFQAIFPPGEDPGEYADALRRLEAVVEVRLPPQIALP